MVCGPGPRAPHPTELPGLFGGGRSLRRTRRGGRRPRNPAVRARVGSTRSCTRLGSRPMRRLGARSPRTPGTPSTTTSRHVFFAAHRSAVERRGRVQGVLVAGSRAHRSCFHGPTRWTGSRTTCGSPGSNRIEGASLEHVPTRFEVPLAPSRAGSQPHGPRLDRPRRGRRPRAGLRCRPGARGFGRRPSACPWRRAAGGGTAAVVGRGHPVRTLCDARIAHCASSAGGAA